MAGIKRASSRITRLTAQQSPHSSVVTLFQLSDSKEDLKHAINDDSPARPAKRVKHATAVDSESNPEGSESTKNPEQTSPRKTKSIQQELAIPHPAPAQWRAAYDAIKEMRSKILAPVDTMGCDIAQRKESEPKVCLLREVCSLSSYSAKEPKICNPRFPHAVVSNKGRSNRRCCEPPAECPRRDTFRRKNDRCR
jgi:endonuclease-3